MGSFTNIYGLVVTNVQAHARRVPRNLPAGHSNSLHGQADHYRRRIPAGNLHDRPALRRSHQPSSVIRHGDEGRPTDVQVAPVYLGATYGRLCGSPRLPRD